MAGGVDGADDSPPPPDGNPPPPPPGGNPASAQTAGDLYADLIQKQLADEDQRKASIEQKGTAVVTSSGVLVTLLFGLAGFTTATPGFKLSGSTALLLGLSLGAFLLAAIGGIASNWLLNYPVISVAAFTHLLGQSNGPFPPARFRVSQASIGILKGSRKQTNKKAFVLTAAQAFQVVAVALAAWAVLTIVLAHQPTAPVVKATNIAGADGHAPLPATMTSPAKSP
jgi:hypothetical protein